MNHVVKIGETLAIIALNYRINIQLLINANHIQNPNLIYPGQIIKIPGLPDIETIPYSIHISVGNRKLVLRKKGIATRTYPIAVGQMVTETPIGDFVVVNREPNPGGPFGAMWLSLSKMHYGIHGTNDPNSIGKAVSKGCIRMHNKDVLELSTLIPNGTPVSIRP